MLTNIIKNIFGTRNTRIIKEYRSLVKIINSLEDKYQKFSQSDFINETINLKQKANLENDFNKLGINIEKDFSKWIRDHMDELPVPKDQINILIPELRGSGATDIVEIPISKIVH